MAGPWKGKLRIGLVAAFASGLTIVAGCGSSGDESATDAAATKGVPTRSASQLAPVQGAYHPAIDPASFVGQIDNRYFPLEPGTAFHYKGVAEDGKTPQSDDMFVTTQTKEILGVKCTVIRDIVSQRGKVVEKTLDWYAQDQQGNVWYMGEDTRELEAGKFVKADDSWAAGVDGAEPGIIMPGDPQLGDEYRQEYYPGYAVDQARVLGSGGPISVPAGSYEKTLLTAETAPSIDPGVAERKYYVAGLGDVKEQTVSGNKERIVLVSVTRAD